MHTFSPPSIKNTTSVAQVPGEHIRNDKNRLAVSPSSCRPVHIKIATGERRSHFFSSCIITGLLLCLLVLQGCAKGTKPVEELPPPNGPAVSLYETRDTFLRYLQPGNQKMTSFRDLGPTIDKSLKYVGRKPRSNVAVSRPGLKVTWGEMYKTLLRLKKLLPSLDEHPELFAEHFRWVPVSKGINYSGYYSPVVDASKTPKKGYDHPIYRRPPDLGSHRGKYYTRRQIEEEGKLANKGLELAWAKDPVDVFFLEIQGSGCLRLDDGSIICINYDGQNGHKYKSSGRIMREKGLLKRGDIFEQRQWLKDNPDRVDEILHENPSFVFFKLGGTGPTGAMGYIVDDWKSLATDRHFIPLGSIVAYGVNIPDQKWGSRPLRAIGFAQDVGGAIKKNRIDIYCGSDRYANYVASFLDAKGPAWILLAK
ncbi:MAG: MltA domain-containing protein [Desulfovibrio sp.]|nr:MltA domain-containing protein [Desulfovibrio sp.]